MPAVVYILRCADDSLYIGSTNDLSRRLHQHNHAKAGARYTKARRPVTLVYTEELSTLGEARSREAALKNLTRTEKLELIRGSGQCYTSPMSKSELAELTEKAKKVMAQYRVEYPDVKMDRDYVPFKITEEWGECLQTYLMLTDRGRQKGKTKAEIKQMFSDEMADVFAYLLIFANAEDINLADAVAKKWFSYLEKSAYPKKPAPKSKKK